MSWRTVVISNVAKLDYQAGFLVARQKETTKIYINEISTLIIESTAVSLTAALLNELTKKNVKVIFCDEKRNPSSELIPYYGSHDTSLRIRRQINWNNYIKLSVWTQIVKYKIQMQKEHLDMRNKEESKMLSEYVANMKLGDSTNREGHAAKVYFNSLFGKNFTRDQDNCINAALNYGYAVLLSSFNREIVASGYITQIGLFHKNMFNQFNLASDLMEPFRPIVDYVVYDLKPNKFEHEEKMKVLEIVNLDVKINGRKESLDNAIKIYCKSVLDALDSNNLSMIKFYTIDEL